MGNFQPPFTPLHASTRKPAKGHAPLFLPRRIELRTPVREDLPSPAVSVDAFLQEPQSVLSGRVMKLLRTRYEPAVIIEEGDHPVVIAVKLEIRLPHRVRMLPLEPFLAPGPAGLIQRVVQAGIAEVLVDRAVRYLDALSLHVSSNLPGSPSIPLPKLQGTIHGLPVLPMDSMRPLGLNLQSPPPSLPVGPPPAPNGPGTNPEMTGDVNGSPALQLPIARSSAYASAHDHSTTTNMSSHS